MKRFLPIIILAMLLLAAPAFAQTVEVDITFGWDAVVHPELAGYNLYVSQTSGNGYILQDTFAQVIEGTTTIEMNLGDVRYFVLTAFTPTKESGFSNEVAFFLPNDPGLIPVPAPSFVIKSWEVVSYR